MRSKLGMVMCGMSLGFLGLPAAARADAGPHAHGFLPHAVCYLWDPALLMLHAVTDALIGLSYVTISATLAYLVYRARRDIPFHWMILAFGTFIVACGFGHFAELYTLWVPRYWLSGSVKVVTALASVATAVVLPPLVPKALALIRAAQASEERAIVLRASEARFRGLLESAPDANVIVNQEARIVLVNAQAEVLFGYRRQELMGEPVERLLSDHVREALAHQRRAHADRRTRPMSVGLNLSAVRKDGRQFPAEISLSPLGTEEGLLVIVVIRDITERKHAEEQRTALLREQAARAAAEGARREAEAARALAESVIREKDEFLSVISHELRTPLTAILGWARMLLLRDFGLTGEARQAVTIIDRNAHSQAQLIDDLLDISRVVGGRLPLDLRPVNLCEALEAAVDVVRPTAEAKGLSLTIDVASGPMVLGDLRRLQQVFWNLLANAVKFTEGGGRITVGLAVVDDQATVTISDTGIGIAADFLPYLFEVFRQADTSSTRKYGGLGLGLAIVRRLVEMHGGSVRAVSAGEGQGATFTVIFPTTRRPAAQAKADTAWQPGAAALPARDGVLTSVDGARVLVVDDEADTRDLVAAVLTSAGADVITAASAGEAFDAVQRAELDVLVADIGMPDEDGYSLMRRIRSLPSVRVAGVPAVALTAYARPEDRDYALAAGFQQHLAKPVDPLELTDVIARLVSIRLSS